MELILNIVWAAIAGSLLITWAAPRLVRVDARRSAVALLALLCVICILFPIISMTDDLNASPAEPETVKSSLALQPTFLLTSGTWILVHDPHHAAFRHEVETQPESGPPAHALLSFFQTRRPPPQSA